jgi:hypothetical protein
VRTGSKGRLYVWCALICAVGVPALVVTGAASAAALTRYVSSSGDNTANDCTDSGNPCATVQYAVDQADEGDTIDVAGTIDDNVTVRISLTITQWPGQAPAVLDGTSSDIVVTVDGTDAVVPPVVTLSGLTIQNGASFSSDGGGIVNNATLTVSNSTIANNSSLGVLTSGGGIANSAGGTLTVENSTISGNLASFGGGIDNHGTLDVENSMFSGNSGDGGGISDESDGTLTVASSTFSGNSGSEGGAILESGTGTVVRSTITGNSANGGAGISVQPGATLLVAESTFTGNSALFGGALRSNGALTVESSTITGNSADDGAAIAIGDSATLAGDILAEQQGPNCVAQAGGFTDDGYNVDDDGTCGLSSANHSVSHSTAIADYLSSLTDNGGPTQTVALLNTPSPATVQADPAVGAIPPSFDLPEAVDGKTAACSIPDQRGIAPAAIFNCDMGAYLLQPTTTSLAASANSTAQGGSVTYTATVAPLPDGGTVAFSDGAGNPATANCAAQTVTGGQATCTVSYPAAGSYSVAAGYSGTANSAKSSSSSLSLTVNDTEAPTAPANLSGRISHNALILSWGASNDNVGVDHYEAYRDGGAIKSVAGTQHSVTLRSFNRHGPTAYTVRAFDAAGNAGDLSGTVTAKPTPRPKSAPKKIPRWAWKLHTWQTHHNGARPATPKPLPRWYAAWAKWRNDLFELVG